MTKPHRKPRRHNAAPDRPAPGEPPRLDLGFLNGLLGYMLRRAQLAVYQDFFRTFADANVRPAQFAVLAILERNPGLKQTAIATALGIKRTNFVGLIDGLEGRGLLERRVADHDRRSSALHLTDEGRVLLRRLKRLVDVHERRIAAGLHDAERRQLLALLERIADISRA